ncbi:ATP-dependent RNA helicase HrpA [Subtercola sp. PAMC28395]|uniref:ATP-dependent RNA helicase HrpA n=1 Tax=Subtercola sp. PAMC28395 TaxID=2846775 RepID=UPI001C0B63B2|nr:ATP-dependent RNA helicase HrpA [Subtercola sp. PAMC28395]QWT23819.1 ATP-dependent RNA helicase HrpA [Subtercola sp. PAMC28395]
MNAESIYFPPELPVSQLREEIARTIAANQVVIVAGETGSGKTTQLPKICLELGRTSIGHTQPRRIAARTIAERIAEELGQEVGDRVGYQVRFTDTVGPNTQIKLMTDGILLNEIHRDRLLTKYDTIIIDEAHERSLTIDFLLGYLRQLLPKRPDLKVIVTSATIDPGSFSRHFGGAPIIEVSGRTYPVEVRYRPLVADGEVSDDVDDESDDDEAAPARRASNGNSGTRSGGGPNGGPAARPALNRDPLDAVNEALDELAREGDGDVLVFFSGENEIRDAEEAIRGRLNSGGGGALGAATEVLPLYGRLSSADQHKVFQKSSAPGIRRRIVLATNVAETSLTVPGIKYVIDTGTARISRYSVRSKVQRLPIEAISQASANQRAGRSGRTSDGICIRLYSEDDYLARPEFTEPEILRTNLAAVILQMISLGLGDIASFPFLQPPDSRGIKDGLDLLSELGAINPPSDAKRAGRGVDRSGGGRNRENPGRSATDSSVDSSARPGTASAVPTLTRVGRDLSRMPIEPRFARMVIESKNHRTSREVMIIVSGLTVQDPRERPLERRQRADELHARFTDVSSDFLSLLNLWNYLEEKQRELSSSAFRRLCKAEHLNYVRVREWQDVFRQLRQLSKPLNLTIGEPSVNPDGIHRSILSGLLSHIGLKDVAKKDYVGARQTRFSIFPGSALAKKQPNSVMSAELVETSRLFARMNATIDPAWAESLAGDLCKRTYSEPHWEKKQGAVVAYERVTLYGVPIVPKRRVQFSRIDPAYARELFIRHALVEGDWESQHAFDRDNRRFRSELAEIEERSRRRDLLLDDEAVFEFYDARVPREVNTARSFDGWWKKAKYDTPELLTMTLTSLVPEGAPEIDEAKFPATWQQGDQQLALSYRFEPGTEDDGVSVTVPLTLLPRLEPSGFESQVPGFRDELVTALIRSLPKNIRKNFVPATDWAKKLLLELPVHDTAGTGSPGSAGSAGSASFVAALAATMSRLAYTPVTAADFDLARIPSHLSVSFRVVDDRGKTLAASKDLGSLQSRFKGAARESVARASGAAASLIERRGITTWDFDELPQHLDTKQPGSVIRAYPAIVDEKTSVAIRLVTTPAEAARLTPAGVRRLLLLGVASPVSYVREHLSQNEKLVLATSPYPSIQALFDDCLLAAADHVLRTAHPDGRVFTRGEFEAVRDTLSSSIIDLMYQTVATVATSLTRARDAERALKKVTSVTLLTALADARSQLGNLVFAGFIASMGIDQLSNLPRYLTGIEQRLQKLPDAPARDRAWMTEAQNATARYEAAGGVLPLPLDAWLAIGAPVVKARWMIEELRISLFAQSLGTAEPVSLQRIVKLLGT